MARIDRRVAPAAFMKVATCEWTRLSRCLAVLVVVACSTGAPTFAQSFTEYSIPTAASQPSGITVGPDGNLWFTELSGNKIGKVTTTGTFTEYTIPTAASSPENITAGPDGNLWFTEATNSANKIGKVTTTGTFTEYTIPTAASQPLGITAGPDGNLWFTEYIANQIGKVTTTGTFTEYSVPTAASHPYEITVGPDGKLWFPEIVGNQIGKVTTMGAFTEYALPIAPQRNPLGITADPDGNLWFTEYNVNQIGKVTTAGTFTEYPIPTVNSGPEGIAADSDGNLWFAEFSGNQIGEMTTTGAFTEYPIPTVNGGPAQITVGPDGNLWFTESSANKIGVLTLPEPECPPTPAGGCRGSGKSLLLLKNSADDTKDKLTWKWIKGAATTLADLGVPTGTTNYTLCVYAGTAVATVNLRAGAKWQAAGASGFKFKDSSGTPDGAQNALLKSGAAGKAKALVKGKGSNLPDDLVGMLPLPVTAQLVNDTNNVCFQAVYNTATTNTGTQFKAKTP